MEPEDLEPRKQIKFEIGQDLGDISVEELRELKDELYAQITRIEAEIAKKRASVAAADAVFKN